MRTKRSILLFIAFFLVIGLQEALAAGGPPGPPTGPPPCWPPPCIPIDGGIGFLIAAGAAYAGKKLYDARKEQQA